jgi:hypothetical protein
MMNLEGLLTFFGLLVAALAIMGPVQRRALALFIPKWLLPTSILVALLFLVLRDMPLGIPTLFGWRLDLVSYLLTLGAFVVPVGAALYSWGLWLEARLSDRNVAGLEPFLQTTLQQGEFQEVDRILRKNWDRLPKIPAGAAALLFDPKVVRRLVNSHSFLHLELLARRPFLESLENRLQAVEIVVREMLEAGTSPIQSAVVSEWGGIEHLGYSDQDRKLIAATFQSPDWYHGTNAHYPLIITAINKIQGGTLDESYNRPDENYAARQGVSKRATCPLYLAVKTEVLAINAALTAGSEKDFYVSDLFQILQKIFDHSKFDSSSSNVPVGMQAEYTPYSFLIENIVRDIDDLTETAVQESVRRHIGAPEDTRPSRIGIDLVRMWSFSLWEIMGEPNKLDPVLRDSIVESYFRFLFALGWQPSEVLDLNGQNVKNLNHWRDRLLKELKERLQSPEQGSLDAVRNVLAHLDFGKPFIADGYRWLETVFPKQFLPNKTGRSHGGA